jgi:hypothetical protein
MSVTISPVLEKVPYWPEIRDYVNKQMEEEGWDDAIFVRSANREEEIQLRESGNNIFVTLCEGWTFELVVGLGKYLDFKEIKELHRKLGIASDKSILMHLWIAQIVCLGKYLGGCDS